MIPMIAKYGQSFNGFSIMAGYVLPFSSNRAEMKGKDKMTDFQINDHILQKECEILADEFLEEFADDIKAGELDTVRDEAIDWAHQTADGHQWVIYNYQALQLCANCDTEYGESFVDDCFQWLPGESTIYSVAAAIAYGEMYCRICASIDEKLDEIETE